MGLFDGIKNFFTKTIAKPAQSFFTKSIAGPTQQFFSKGGMGENILGGINRGLSTVGKVVSPIVNNPLFKAGLMATMPELAVPLMAGSTLLSAGTKLTDRKTYQQPAGKVGSNLLEIAKQVQPVAHTFA